MTIYYVAPAGYPGASSSNPGTSSAAPKSFTYGATDYTTWLNSLVDGDYVRQYPGNYHGTGYAQQTLTKRLIIDTMSYGADDLSQDWFGDGLAVASRFTRNVEWHGFFLLDVDTTTNGIWFRPMVWPSYYPDTGDTWAAHSTPFAVVMVQSGAKWTNIKCEISVGYGPESFAPFDVTRMYEEQKSPTGWYFNSDGTIGSVDEGTDHRLFNGHGNWPNGVKNYNALGQMPNGFNVGGSGGGSIDSTDIYVHDVNNGFVAACLLAGATFKLVRPWIERFYADAAQTPTGNFYWATARIHGAVMTACFGDPYDAGNPHSDNWQVFANGSATRIPNLRLTNTLAYDQTVHRSSSQFGFWGGSVACPMTGGLVSKCLVVGPQKALSCLKSVGSLLDKTIAVVPADAVGGQIPAPAGVTNKWFDGQTGDSGVIGDAWTQVVVGAAGQVRTSSAMARDSIVESINFTGKMTRDNVAVVGHGGATVPLTNVFADAEAERTTPASVFAAFTPIGAYADKGPGYATIREMLEAPVSFADQEVFVGIGDSTLAAPNQTIESLPFPVFGGDDGDPISVSVPAGVQWRCVDIDDTTALTAYSSVDGNVTAGKRLQLERTSALGASTKQAATIMVGGQPFVWNVTTRSNNDLPGYSKGATSYLSNTDTRFKRNGANYAADTKHGIMWLDFVVPSTHGLANGTYNFITGLSGRTLRCQVSIIAGVYHCTLSFMTGLAAVTAFCQFLNLSYDKRYRLGMSVDTSQADATGGSVHANRVWAGGYNVSDNIALTPSLGSTKDALIGTTGVQTSDNIRIFTAVPMTVYGYYCEFERSLQMLGITPRDGWNYTTDDLGPAGEGIMANPLHVWTGPHSTTRTYNTNDGVTYSGKSYVSLVDGNLNNLPTGAETDNAYWKHVRRRPWGFLVGKASAPGNLGTGNTFALSGTGSLTDVNGQAHPPSLALIAEQLSAGPYNVGDPIDVLVTPAGFPKDVTLTPASDKAGSWAATTTLMPLGSAGVFLTFTPAAHDHHTLSMTNDGGYTNPPNIVDAVGRVISFTISPAPGYTGSALSTSIRIVPA